MPTGPCGRSSFAHIGPSNCTKFLLPPPPCQSRTYTCDVLFVAPVWPDRGRGINFNSVGKHRAAQIATMWDRAWPAMACSEVAGVDVAAAVLVIHVANYADKWCMDVLELPQLRFAAHVLDSVDWTNIPKNIVRLFDGIIAMNSAHEQLLQREGAKNTFVLGYQTMRSTGCAPLPDASLEATRARLPIVPSVSGTCPGASQPPLPILVMGTLADFSVKLTTRNEYIVNGLRVWERSWCDKAGRSLRPLQIDETCGC